MTRPTSEPHWPNDLTTSHQPGQWDPREPQGLNPPAPRSGPSYAELAARVHAIEQKERNEAMEQARANHLARFIPGLTVLVLSWCLGFTTTLLLIVGALANPPIGASVVKTLPPWFAASGLLLLPGCLLIHWAVRKNNGDRSPGHHTP